MDQNGSFRWIKMDLLDANEFHQHLAADDLGSVTLVLPDHDLPIIKTL